jgi:hypothetical protein
MSNLFIKYPNDAYKSVAGQETIVNLQNIIFIEKNDSYDYLDPTTTKSQINIYCVYFHISEENYFSYRTRDKKTRDDFFEAILQKLSLNNNIENTEEENLNSYSQVNKILCKAFLNYQKRLKD